jgi:hypothetical protein
MTTTYNLDYDDDEEDETELNITIQAQKPSTWQLQDIEKLKVQTNSLLDPKWKETRNQHLLHKMLELDQPAITVKMVDFLLQDNVIEKFVGFITQNGSGRQRPSPTDQLGEEMKLSYKAVLLLSPDMITDPLNTILTKKAAAITRKLFDIFRTDSAGSFYHAYRVLECLLRLYPAETFEGLTSDGLLPERMVNVTRYIGYPPVCELLIMLIALTPLPRSSPVFGLCSKARWAFLEEMNQWGFMVNMAKVVCNPTQHCLCDSYVSADQHSTAAAQLLQDLTEKLSLEDTGDLLLLPFGKASVLMDELIDCSVDVSREAGMRRSAAKLICFLLRRAAESEIVCFIPGASPNAPPSATYLPNRLYALRENIVIFIRNRMDAIMAAILAYDTPTDPLAPNSSNGKAPFGVLRQLLIEVLVLMVESDETIASLITLDLFKAMISWTLHYAYNNIYHAVFYRLIFAVLRQGQEDAQRVLFKKAKFASFLIDNFVPYQVSDDGDGYMVQISDSIPKNAPQYDLRMRRVGVRGLLMNCANAIRLQINNNEKPDSFLLIFLNSHPKWNDEFVPQLTMATDLHMQFGLGIEINQTDRPVGGGEAGWAADRTVDDNLDVSTRFARSLGFFEEGHWSLEAPTLQHVHDLQEDSELGGHLHANHPSSHMGGDQSNSQDVTQTPDVLTKQQQQPQFQRSIRRGSLEDPGGHFSYLATAEDDYHDGAATPPPAPPAEEEEAA